MQHRAAKTIPAEPLADEAPLWRSPTLGLAIAGALLLWIAFPPLDLWLLAWLAPLPWLWLVRCPKLPGKRPYQALWLAGFLYWLLMLFGVSQAHKALIAGWIALSWYLAFYLPLFVWLARVAVHRLGISLVVAAPVVWVGLELIRGHLLTGFSLALVSHSQVYWPALLQVSDLGGAYAVSFVMLLVSASLARMLPLAPVASPRQQGTWTFWPAGIAAATLIVTLGYGTFRLRQTPPHSDRDPLRVALIQGSLDTIFNVTAERIDETFNHYERLTGEARRTNERLDLVIWPESMFMVPQTILQEPLAAAPGEVLSPERLRAYVNGSSGQFQAILTSEAALVNVFGSDGTRQATPTWLLLGTNTFVAGPGDQRRSYNTALLADAAGQVVDRYHKMHPVMFGEYIPFADAFPWLYQLTPMTGGLSVGDRPRAFTVKGMTLSPSICFESVVPHLIRRQVVELARRGTPPDVLVNVTNDGWFWGSAILDLHFRCAIFRAIENRKPVIIAANTGFSAWIDGNGRVLAQGPRRTPQVLIADVVPDGRASPYHWLADWPATLCGLACLVLAAIGWRATNPASRQGLEKKKA